MKNKLFLALSILTAGLNVQASLVPSTFLSRAQAILTHNWISGRATVPGMIALPATAVTGLYFADVPGYVSRQMKNAADVEAYGFIQGQGTVASSMTEKLKNAFNTSKAFAVNHKVAISTSVAGLAVGGGLAYAAYKKYSNKKPKAVQTPVVVQTPVAPVAQAPVVKVAKTQPATPYVSNYNKSGKSNISRK